jgi:hypothetical protein
MVIGEKLSFVVINSQSTFLYLYASTVSAAHRSPKHIESFCKALQPQKPKNVLLHGSTGCRSLRTTICLAVQAIYIALSVPKVQGLPLHGSTATEAQGCPFIWLYRTHKVNKPHLYGYIGHTSPRTLIWMALKSQKTKDFNLHRSTDHRRRITLIHVTLKARKDQGISFSSFRNLFYKYLLGFFLKFTNIKISRRNKCPLVIESVGISKGRLFKWWLMFPILNYLDGN